jgi:hypothetical protein
MLESAVLERLSNVEAGIIRPVVPVPVIVVDVWAVICLSALIPLSLAFAAGVLARLGRRRNFTAVCPRGSGVLAFMSPFRRVVFLTDRRHSYK